MTHCTCTYMLYITMYTYTTCTCTCTLYLQEHMCVSTSTTNIFLCHFMTADEINNVSMTAHCCKYNRSLLLLKGRVGTCHVHVQVHLIRYTYSTQLHIKFLHVNVTLSDFQCIRPYHNLKKSNNTCTLVEIFLETVQNVHMYINIHKFFTTKTKKPLLSYAYMQLCLHMYISRTFANGCSHTCTHKHISYSLNSYTCACT